MKTNLLSVVMGACLFGSPVPLFAAITVSVSDVTVTEGEASSFAVTLSSKSKEKITIDATFRDGSATGKSCGLCFSSCSGSYDYACKGTYKLEFNPGEITKLVQIITYNDTCHEPDETFFLDLSNPRGPVTIGKGTGTCTIVDNDGPTRCCCGFGGICLSFSSCCCGGVGEGVPAEPSTPVGVPINYGILWTVPPPDVWRSLNTMDIRLVGVDEETILTVRWDEESNTFSLLSPGNGEFQHSDVPGSPQRFEGSDVALLLENSDVIGSGPTGPSVLLNLNLIFKPRAAGQTFRVDAHITNDAGIEKGFDPVGTITVLPTKE